MAKFESNIKQIAYSQEAVYRCISDLSNIEKIRDRIPADKFEKLAFTSDEITIGSPVGEVTMKIIERDEPKCVKFQTVQSPVPMTMWVQMLPVEEQTSKIRVTIDADIPIFLKGMVTKPLQEGIEKIADALAMIPYEG
jgi:carbon monoxide dehydrogenase subunit G